jgi:DNA-binding protein HU-beta
MNKVDIIDAIAEAASISKKDAAAAAEKFIECIKDSLCNKETVSLVGFGSFESSYRAERKGHNPHTGQSMVIPASYSVKFKPAKRLKDVVNEVAEKV